MIILNISIFEMGKGFYKENDEYKEDLKLAVLMSGDYKLAINNEKVDFYYLKGIMEELLYFLGYGNRYSLLVKESIPKELHPGQSAIINVDGQDLGIIGKLHPLVHKDDIYVMELNLTQLLKTKTRKMNYKEISKFPSVVKDVAFIIDNHKTSAEIEKVIKQAGGKMLEKINVFDIYPNIEEEKKSIAYKLTFSNPNKTLSDEEVMEVFEKIIKEVEAKTKSKLRNN